MLEDHTRAASTPLRILTFSGPCQVFMAGFLPFSAIYIELHYIFASVWGHKLYTLYGILFLAVGMLVVGMLNRKSRGRVAYIDRSESRGFTSIKLSSS